ncbi:hypothetical protein DICPUDRAFT_36866, partial [Dictyostelium purpureum]
IATNNVPNFYNINVNELRVWLIDKDSTLSLENLNTLNKVVTFQIKFDGEMDFPIPLGSSNNRYESLKIFGSFKVVDKSGYELPDSCLYYYQFKESPNFNINGKLPFKKYPKNLTTLSIYASGLTIFPTDLPNTIEALDIKNNFLSNNGELPDLSMYPLLNYLYLYNTGFSGSIPESYCSLLCSFPFNNLTGTWPQCKVCYESDFFTSFDNNPLLQKGVCDTGSLVPSLKIVGISGNKYLFLTGNNLGLSGPHIQKYNLYFSVGVKQSEYNLLWSPSYGEIPETIVVTIGPRDFKLATIDLTPIFINISGSGNEYNITGSNFSYNKADFKVMFENIEGTIKYIDFNTITVQFDNPEDLPNGDAIPAKIINIKSNLSVDFNVKINIFKHCTSDCGASSGKGSCDSKVGKCICIQKWTGDTCSTPNHCPKDCSLNGILNGDCNKSTGQCKCYSGWGGFDCNSKTTTENPSTTGNCGASSGKGSCDSKVGKCICIQKWTGDTCSTPNQFLTSASSTSTKGGVVNLYGWFGTPNVGLKIYIDGAECKPIHTISETFVNCTIGAGSGTKSIKIVQNNKEWIGNNMFHYNEDNYSCPKDCSLNGILNGDCNKSTGQCKCYSGWGGFDCNSKTTTENPSTTGSTTTTPSPTNPPEIEIPKSNTTVNESTGSTVITNQQTLYEISIISLVELDVLDNVVLTYNLTNKWVIDNNITNNNIHIFKQNITDICNITYTVEDIKEQRDYEFAGLQLTLDKDSIKITVSIHNYPFTGSLNKLQLRIESSVDDINENINNQCNNKETSIDSELLNSNQLLNYITISKNQKVLNGRFINRVLSDNRQSFITTSLISNTTIPTQTNSTQNNKNKQSFIIGINLPYFTESLTIDPDFSVLVSPSFKKCSNSGRASWVLPVAIVVPCVAVVTILIVGAIVYNKNRTSVLIIKKKFSFKKNHNLYMPNGDENELKKF